MLDLPEDVSNKKYISNEPEAVGVIGQGDIPVADYTEVKPPIYEAKKVFEKPAIKKNKVKNPRKSIFTRENLTKLTKFLKQKWFNFKTVQYPAIYTKIYDLYYFELVPYRPIDLALKGLILLTILIILFIVLIILLELLRLIF
jgi:hypothetical protein